MTDVPSTAFFISIFPNLSFSFFLFIHLIHDFLQIHILLLLPHVFCFSPFLPSYFVFIPDSANREEREILRSEAFAADAVRADKIGVLLEQRQDHDRRMINQSENAYR